MQELTGLKPNSGEQNKDMSKARQKRAALDTLVILTNIADRDPFSADPNLRNIMTGVNLTLTMLLIFIVLELLERRYCPR